MAWLGVEFVFRNYARRAQPPAIQGLAAAWLCGGIGALASPERLPDCIALAAGLAAALACFRGRWILAGGLCGIMFTLFAVGAGLDDRLHEVDRKPVRRLEGVVDSLPVRQVRRRVFTLRVESPPGLPGRVRLAWYEPGPAPMPRPGERWRFTARLKPPRGLANPGGTDWEGWLLRAGIGATGYVSGPSGGERLDPAADGWLALRGRLRSRVAAEAGGGQAGEVAGAIVTGLRAGLAPRLREVLSSTGTGHLLAISGLHVGLAAGLGAGAVLFAGRFRRRAARPLADWAALGALAAAAGYAAVAGWPVSARRAVIMLAAGLAAMWLRRRPGVMSVLCAAGVIVLAADPLALLDPGLWMSFGAVAAIAWAVAGRAGPPGRAEALLRMQVVLSLAMLCATSAWFGRISVISAAANLIAVPWFSLLVIPCALGGAALLGVIPPLGSWLLTVAGWGVERALQVLEFLAALPWASRGMPEPSAGSVACACAGVAWLTMPRPAPARPLAACLFLPLFAGQPAGLLPGEFELRILDVGQGLAAVVRTAGASFVYDAGPRWPGGDAGRSTLVPALRALGVDRLDGLVLSHGDSDHAGGGHSVLRAVGADAVYVGEGAEAPGSRACTAGLGWIADGVSFRFLAPEGGAYRSRNDASCVLQIAGAGGRVLLPGDVERQGETRLVRSSSPASDVVVAPHHGSRSSSGSAFVEATRPAWVVFAAGWRNRWGFPHPDVVARWFEAGALPAGTDRSGELVFRFRRGGPDPPAGRRSATCRAWRDCGRVAGP